MKGETGKVPMRFADFFPLAIPKDFGADPASGVFNQRNFVLFGNLHKTMEIAGHADLVDAEDRTRQRSDRGFDETRIDVVSGGIDIDKNRSGAAVADAVGGGDIRVTD